ncbi:ArnT family glycosyltransferase [Fundidesulfovibrio terrae]|uniref:ArnT family glycosyltransferase n=1 Tax=Fundidesulfovibrio terrae TaxID=2922866 RepID=UPI001FB0041B|nr:glycosyltransferase family 39 protein [Fundidesulfovibrio terrae]
MADTDDSLSYGLPPSVCIALLVFVFVNVSAILQMRGVSDSEGYVLNTSKAIPVNTYEDDAQVSIMHALWYFGPTTNTFDVATNFGGPLLHVAKPVMWLGAKLGWIKRFDDRSMYVLYPGELGRIFKLFAFYKLAVLTLLPLSCFWLLNNFFSRRAGELAAWLVAAMPFLTGFELRLKPDGVVFALTMLSLLHQFAFQKHGRSRNLYLAVLFFSLGASMKFTMASAVFPLAVCAASGMHRRWNSLWGPEQRKLLWRSALFGIVVFVVANPRILPGFLIFFDFITRYTSIPAKEDLPGGIGYTIWFRLTHFAPFLGRALGVLALPALAYGGYRALREKRLVTPWSCLVALYLLHPVFLWVIAHNHVILNITYYYYSQALLTLLLIAVLFDGALAAARRRPLAHLTAWACVIVLIGHGFSNNINVLRYLSGPSTRQLAQAWVDRNIPPGTSLGLPIASGNHLTFNDRFLADPFRHRILPLGRQGEETGKAMPDYVLWVQTNPLQAPFSNSRYETLARFDTGSDLPREPYNFYQDDIYTVYRRVPQAPLGGSPGPADADAALGSVFADISTEPFTVLQYKASGVFPNALTMYSHVDNRFIPIGQGLLLSSIRHPSSPAAYLHQLPPELMALWGVKYVLALQDQAFTEKVENDPAYALTPTALPAGAAFPQGMRLYTFGGYTGMAHFLSAPAEGMRYGVKPRWMGLLERHKLKTFGPLYPMESARPGPNLLRVRMVVDCDGPFDLLLKGGEHPLSIYLGAGHNDVDVPLPLAEGVQPGYELNPAAPGASCSVQAIQAYPTDILPVESCSYSLKHAFASVTVKTDGLVAFALPYHPFWKARVDGAGVLPEKSPGNTVGVPVGPGHHFIELVYDDL